MNFVQADNKKFPQHLSSHVVYHTASLDYIFASAYWYDFKCLEVYSLFKYDIKYTN